MTHRNADSDRCTRGEQCRGVLELLIIVGIVVWTMTSDSLLMLPALAAAGAVLVTLAIWDDVAARRAVHNVPASRHRRPPGGAAAPGVGSRTNRAA